MTALAAVTDWRGAPAAQIPWPRLDVLVCGIGRSGTAAAETLLRRGARVTVVDARDGASEQGRADALRALGGVVLLGAPVTGWPAATAVPDLAVVSPGWRPDHPVLSVLARAGVPVWGEVELAWRATPPATRWLAVTGTNGKTTTVEMLAAMLRSGGRAVAAAGNIGTPLLEVLARDPAPDWLAVELSSFQLHWSSSVRPFAAAVLNVAPDHLDWHGDMPAYARAKSRVWARMGEDGVAVVNLDDPWSTRLAATVTAPRTVGITLREPQAGQLGIAGGALVDRAFADAEPLARTSDLRLPGRHNLSNALAAAALARAAGLPAQHVAAALREFRTGAHRLAEVTVVDGVRYVDDSKATNPHAAERSLASFSSVVWVAGGLNKGLSFDALVRAARPRLRAAVLIGQCRGEIRAALDEAAPDLPVDEAESMEEAVRMARRWAQPGDTVLLAPAAASMDMFTDYAERGAAFTAAARRLQEVP